MIAARSISTTLRSHVARHGSRALAFDAQCRINGGQESTRNLSALIAAGLLGTLTSSGSAVTTMEPAEKSPAEKPGRKWNPFRRNRGGDKEVAPKAGSAKAIPAVARHEDVSVWQKGDRLIYVVGAKNYSQASADLTSNVVRDVKPAAVFIDINEKVFFDFGIYDEAKKLREKAGITKDKKLRILAEGKVEEKLKDIPNYAEEKNIFARAMDSISGTDAVEDAIKDMFATVKYAGVDQHAPQAASGAHYHQAIVEGQKAGSVVVLGARSFEVTKERGDEAMKKSDAGAATAEKDLEWRPNLSARENFRRVRGEFEKAVPAFHQVMFPELDAHMAGKLDKLNEFDKIVAVVMMIHVDGVEDFLQKKGWQQVKL